MTNLRLISTSTLQRSRWLALPAVLVALGGVLWWWTRNQNRSIPEAPLVLPEIEPLVETPLVEAVPPVSLPTATPQSPLRWLLYLGSTLAFAGLLIVLQNTTPELSAALFVLLLLAALGYATVKNAGRMRNALLDMRANVVIQVWQGLRQYADALSILIVTVALLCVIWGALVLREVRNYDLLLEQAMYLIVLAGIGLGVAMTLKPDLPVYAGWKLVEAGAGVKSRFNVARAAGSLVATMGGILLLFLLAETNGRLMGSDVLAHVHHVVQFMFLVVGSALVVVGLGGRVRLPHMTRREVLVVGGVAVLALVLRVVVLDTSIMRFVDEANFMDAVPRLWSQPDARILYPFSDVTAFTWVYPILQSGVSNVIGSGLIALRLPSALFGTLGIVALYFLVRTLFHDKVLASIAIVILATFPPHLHFSRIGLNNIADPLFGTLAIAFLMRGFQSNRRSDFVVAGAMLGLTQYFYEGGRLLYPPLWALALLIAWLSTGRKRTDAIHSFYGLLAAVLIAVPVYYTLIATHYPLLPRLQNEGFESSGWAEVLSRIDVGYVGTLKDRVLNPFLLYTTHADQSWFYGGKESIVMLVLIPFFLLGLAHALWKMRSAAVLIILAWVMATTVGNIFLRESLWIPRYVVAFPALALLIAIGIWATLFLWLPRSVPQRWLVGIAVSLCLLSGIAQTVFYFREQLPAFIVQFQNDEDWNDAFFRMAELPDGTHVHIVMESPVWSINVVAFVGYYRLNIAVDTQMPQEITPTRLEKLSQRQSATHVFFVNPKEQGLLRYIGQCFKLSAVEYSPYSLPRESQLGLYRAIATPSRSCGFPLEWQLWRDDITAILP